jgi:hypothetical protein
MIWIMEPLSGFKSIVSTSAAEGCTGTWIQCACTFGLAVCETPGGLVFKPGPEEKE